MFAEIDKVFGLVVLGGIHQSLDKWFHGEVGKIRMEVHNQDNIS